MVYSLHQRHNPIAYFSEETAEDMRAHTHAIQENEHNQFQELTAFLDLEMNFIQSYLDVLTDVKADWLGQ